MFLGRKYKPATERKNKMKTTILAVALFAAAASAFTALPALGYSASSGFIIGGYLLFPLATPGDQFTIDTYYGTAGVIKFQPGLVRRFSNGFSVSTLEYRKVLSKKWYGWGNNTDPDSSAAMDYEKQNFLANLTVLSGSGFSFTGGLDIRHSAIFNREESILWERLPGDVFSSTWTAGLSGRITYTVPVPHDGSVLFAADGFFQAGDVSYSGITGMIRGTVNPWESGTIALGGRIHRQFNVSETPVPYASGIGQNVNFRGYSDYRFTGPVWTLYQLQVKNDLFTAHDFEGNHLLTIAAVAFAEAGSVAERPGDLSTESLHTDLGLGLRFEIQHGAEMRIDAAWGDEGMLIQTGFDQAF